MIVKDDNVSRAIMLRDFFLAGNRTEMEASCRSFLETKNRPVPTPDEWKELEFSFNRLFVGPRAVIAPPYASVYLDNGRYVMGEAAQTVRKLYHLVGLSSPWEGKLPDDHVSLELDACLHFRHTIGSTNYELLVPVYDYFLNRHLQVWIPDFVKQIKEMPDLPVLINWIASELLQWLYDERKWFSLIPVHESESLFLDEEKPL